MNITKQQATVVLVVILSFITLANAALGAWNYYRLKDQIKHEHVEFRLQDKKTAHVGTVNCEEIELVKEALRATIEKAQAFTKSSPVRSKQEKEQSELYYEDVLKRFKAKDCKGGESPFSKNSSKSSRATQRPSHSGRRQSSTSSSPQGSSPSSTVPTTR